MKNIAILASGNGTNGENIARFFAQGNRVRVVTAFTNRRNAGVIARMQALEIPVEYFPDNVWDNDPEKIIDALKAADTDLVVLAGFMHYVHPDILKAFPDAVINIHPSLLPAYGGKGMWGHHVHQAVIAAGETESGVTVHYVTDEFDKGEILMQEKVTVSGEDTPETLETKIHTVEYNLYPRAIVAALQRLDKTADDGAGKLVPDQKIQTPPPVPKNPDQEWAEVLKVNYDPAAITPPPVPPVVGNFRQSEADHIAPGTEPKNTSRCDEPMPPTYMLWAILSTVCCCFIPGIVAIVFSAQVSSKYYSGDIEGSRKASGRAEIWIIVSFVLGVLSSSLSVPLSILGM